MNAASYDFGKPIKNGEFTYVHVSESEADPTCAEASAEPMPTATQPAFKKSATLRTPTPPVGTMRKCANGASR